jgi:predicted transcriptional regulator
VFYFDEIAADESSL